MTAGAAGPLRDGFALVLSMLIVIALAVLSTGMLIVAAQEAGIASAAAAAARARTAAEAEVRRALSAWSTRRASALPPGAALSTHPRPEAELAIRRLDSTLFVVTARVTASFRLRQAEAGAGALVRTLDPLRLQTRVSVAAAAADTSARLEGGSVSGLDACALAPPLPGVLAPAVDGAATLDGDPPVTIAPPPVDPLAGIPLRAIADVVPTGAAGSPRPAVEASVCAPGPWNWATARPDHPCGTPALIHSEQDLTLRGGEGFGVLVVDGDLTITGDFVFHGLLHVRGRLLLDGGSVTGAVRAGHLLLRQGQLRYDSCALEQAFRAPAFDRAFRPPGRWWVPVF